jgi:transcription-repair coupling factor (superfamily II helicase)
MLYRRVAGSRTEPEIDRVLEETRDRYGPVPDSVLNLADYGRIRVMADRLNLESIDRQGPLVVLKFRSNGEPAGPHEAAARPAGRWGPDPARLVRMLSERGDVTLSPPALLKLDLKASQQPAGHLKAGRPRGLPRLGAGTSRGPGGRRYESTGVSWWTARARAGEVKPGFTKEEILKPQREDPRGPEGVLTRVGELLADLLDVG